MGMLGSPAKMGLQNALQQGICDQYGLPQQQQLYTNQMAAAEVANQWNNANSYPGSALGGSRHGFMQAAGGVGNPVLLLLP